MSDNFNEYLGNYIKNIRLNKKLSQEEFCKLLDNKITRSNLSKIELGKISTSAELIRDIIIKFDISPYNLLDLHINEPDSFIEKYDFLDKKDKNTILSMIDVLIKNNSNLSTSMITKNKEGEDNKKSS